MDCPTCWQHQGFEIGPKIISENECLLLLVQYATKTGYVSMTFQFHSVVSCCYKSRATGAACTNSHCKNFYPWKMFGTLSLTYLISMFVLHWHVFFLKHFFTPCMCCRSGPIMRRNQWRRSCIFQRRRSAWQTTNQSMSLKSPTPCTSTPRM